MSSVILLVIVAAWAVVLVPMLLNRHEAANDPRSIDRFATAMRVLARRPAGPADGRYVVVPRRPDSSPSVVVNGTSQWAAEAAQARRRVADQAQRQQERPEARVARDPEFVRSRVATRRRRVLVILAFLAMGLAVPALATKPLLWAAQVPADLLLAGYLIHVRREALRVRARRERAAARARRAAELTAAANAAAHARAAPPALSGASNAVVIERQEDGSWHPVPVPLPTYVTAPPAFPAEPAAPPLTSDEVALDRHLDEMERRLAVND